MRTLPEEIVTAPGDAGPRLGMSVRFRAANGAVIVVTVRPPANPGSREQVLAFAREAIAQVASAQSERVPGFGERKTEHADCGATFWSWATPEA